ncbi:nuclear transport factor 2 family protein [Streptomyces sp. NPDC057757]|uniref:nuclear transport factor 2 family protein n=1 Tax=Streptomyces sp. NPDC057757 TaxID=3346241 RepID=UPI0036A125E7
MSARDNITVVQGFIDNVLNEGDLSALEKYWTEDMVWRGGSLGEYHGLANFRKIAEATFVEDVLAMFLQLGITSLPSAS